MKNYNLIICTLLLFMLSCSKDKSTQFECINTTLEEFEMVAFEGQDMGCKFFLELFHYNNKQYFLLGNHCADMISYPTDCEGNTLCQNAQNSECLAFYRNAKNIGIIGIKE